MSSTSSVARRLKVLEELIGTKAGECSPILIYDPETGMPENSGALFLLPHNGREAIDLRASEAEKAAPNHDRSSS